MPGRKIPVAAPDIGADEERLVVDAVRSGWVSSIGRYIGEFERGFADYCEARHGIAVSNGTTAIEVVLAALGVGRDDEVVVPGLTFAAVAAAVVHLGARPVLADVDPETWCLDPAAAAAAMSPRTRAVVAVHSYGHPADLDALIAIAAERGVPVVEDCAEAHGARYRGRRVGALAAAGTFSFYGNKIITTGEGGIVLTNDDRLADRVRMLKDHAMDPSRRYYHLEAGYNFRMTNVQAALGCAQLRRIDAFLARRSEVLAAYREALADVPGIALNPRAEWAEPVNWIVCAVLAPELAGRRDDLLRSLAERGIDTRPFFVPLGDMPPYRGSRCVGPSGEGNPVARDLSRRGFNLPTTLDLSREDVARIAGEIRDALDA